MTSVSQAATPSPLQPAALLSPSPAPGAGAGSKAFARELDRAASAQDRSAKPSGEGQGESENTGAAANERQDSAANDADIDTRAEAARRAHKLRQGARAPRDPLRLPGERAGEATDGTARSAARADIALPADDADGADPQQALDGSKAAVPDLYAPTVATAATPPRAAHDPLVAPARAQKPIDDVQRPQALGDTLRSNPASPADAQATGPSAAMLAAGHDAMLQPVRAIAKPGETEALEPAHSPRALGLAVPPAKAVLPTMEAGAAGTAGAVGATGLALVAATSPTTAAPATAFHAELAAAVGSDAFAPALGAQLSTLIRDGISHARLNLHPAELGPIAVHIRLDGDMAQVDFSALHAMTRQALEDAVPALASALRESGLTLSGGGVFEQPREARDPRDGMPDTPARSAQQGRDGLASGAQPLSTDAALRSPARGRGVVDLYA
ncbi:MAG: flagellar hook-length control protein FliK [Rubrivivax sp.]